MKNIILQHWTGDLPEIVQLSTRNIAAYADKCGADYKLLRGQIFRSHLTPPCQKIFMLDESLDEYDVVVMLDADMFTSSTLELNIFDDEAGVGMYHPLSFRKVKKRAGGKRMVNHNYPFWGGAIYRLKRSHRKRLRSKILEKDLNWFSQGRDWTEDEGIMHRLATRAQFRKEGAYLSDQWCYGSYFENPEKAYIWHIRGRKMEEYRKLVDAGWIKE